MIRQDAYTLLQKHLQNKNLQKHCLACEAAMKAICKYLHPELFNNPEKSADAKAMADTWGITGLLHDIDYEIAQNENRLNRHGILLFEDSKYKEDAALIPDDIAHGIQAHAYELTGVVPVSQMDWAIYCIDQLTGLIIACALIHPDKKLAPITVEFVQKRMKEKSFAKGAKREPILLCDEKLGIPLDEFIGITLMAMKSIHEELGL